MNERFLLVSNGFLGMAFFFIYEQYVQAIFEARTNFDELSILSRETLLRKEDALYYSFYKTIIEEPDFWQGYKKLLNSSVIEYPNSINIVKRFHVLPEIAIGYIYHIFKYYSSKFELPIVGCWSTGKSSDPNTDIICDGVGEPFNFYLGFVWASGGLTVFFIYMYGSFLSENLFGGLYAVVLYIIFHKNAAKIYERPISRENFAFPFIFWQIFYLSVCFQHAARYDYVKLRYRIIMIMKLTLLTTISLLSWQFSSVIFATQILVMITPWSIGLISNWFCVDFALSHFFATLLAYYISYGNKKYCLSWQNGPAFALFCLSTGKIFRLRSSNTTNNNAQNNNISTDSMLKKLTLGILMAFTSQGTLIDLLEQCGFSKPDDNPFSVYRDLVFHWSLQRRANFSISLLACNADFSEVDWQDFWELVKTLFVKPYCLFGVVLLAKFFRKWRIRSPKEHNLEHIERAKNYILEDFLEENHITMKEMSNKETELELNLCFKLLEDCNYDYEKYKKEKNNLKTNKNDEHDNFVNDVKKLKEQINEKRKEKKIIDDHNNEDILLDNTESKKCIDSNMPGTTKEKDNKTYNNNKRVVKNNNEKSLENNDLGYHYMYSVAQLFVLSVIGLSIKKLFFLCFTQGCVIAPTLCSKFWYKKQNNIFWTISLVVFFTSMIDPGINNIRQEFLPSPTDSTDLENMLEWINLNTEKDAVFGGPIEIIGTIHLTTGRPIVNHPHLEMRQISERTESIYSVFSRQQSSDIYNQFSQLKIQYLVLSFNDCTNSSAEEEMCDILSIWDEMQPSYRKYPQFCAELANKNIPSFLKVFANKDYGIIKMFSQSVQLNLKYNKMSEKTM